MMDLFEDSPCQNPAIPSINIHKRRSRISENDDTLEEGRRKKLKRLGLCSKSTLDLKTPGTGLATRASKAISPISKAPTSAPATTENRREQCNSVNYLSKSFETTSTTGVNRKLVLQNFAPPPNTKDLQKIGSEIVDNPDFDSLKCAIQKALEEHQNCTKSYKECERKYKDSERTYTESSLKLGVLIEKIKIHLPSVLESLPSDVSQSLEDLKDQETRESVCLFKQDSDLVHTLTLISKEFSSYVLVLENIPESRLIKERLLRELKTKEELFEENYAKFKHNKSWLLNKGIKPLELPDQNFLRKKYKNYFQVLDLKLMEMKLKRKELVSAMKDCHSEIHSCSENSINKPTTGYENKPENDSESKTIVETEDSVWLQTDSGCRMQVSEGQNVREPVIDEGVTQEYCFTRRRDTPPPPSNKSVYDSCHYGFQIGTSLSESSDSNSSSASPKNNIEQHIENDMVEVDGSECEENKSKYVKEGTKNVHFEFTTEANTQSWLGESLPVLDDLVSDESLEETTFHDASTSNNGTRTCKNTQPLLDFRQEELNSDQPVVETLITEVGPELAFDDNRDVSQNIGSHFLAPKLTASVFSPTGDGFLYDVALQPTQKPCKKLFHPPQSPENICSECQQNFSNKELLYTHKLHYHATKICNICIKKFDNVCTLKDHVASGHRSHTVCTECFEVVETSSFKAHATKHPVTNLQVDETLKCRACIQTFSTQEEVKNHEKSHKNTFHFCKHCGELFLTRFELQKHSSQEHLAIKTDICKVCYLDFCDRPSLLKHLKTTHNMIVNKTPKDYACICCNHQSAGKWDLIQHMRCDHQNDDLVVRASQGEGNGLPKNKCPHCNSYFKNSKVRAVHEIIFHETPPFRCVCNEAFYTKAMLDRHTLKHNRTDEQELKPKRKQKKL